MSLETLFSKALGEGSHAQITALLTAVKEGSICIPDTSAGKPLPMGITRKNGLLYFEKYALLEEGIASALQKKYRSQKKEKTISLDGGQFVQLTPVQKKAVEKALSERFLLFTGGPGTGKSFTIKKMCEAFALQGVKSILIAAPTGKAAALLTNAIQKEIEGISILSGTLHALLGVNTSHDALNKPLALVADVVIVDECSMVDVTMWHALLSALSEETTLILSGDVNQLPPVEAGSIFSDITEYCKRKKGDAYIHLEQCLRSESEEILELAEAVRSGDAEKALSILEQGKNVQWGRDAHFPPFPENATPEILLDHAKKYRILAAMREGELGAHALNALFKAESNSVKPIIITKNSREIGLYNGDTGIIAPDESGELFAYFSAENGAVRTISAALLPQYEKAYALSIHKSQGSEYEHVTIVIPPGAEVFGRKLIYTGITRARKSVTFVGKKETLRACIQSIDGRKSGLQKRLEKK